MKLFHHPFSGWNTEQEIKIVHETTPKRELPANPNGTKCVCAEIKNQEKKWTLVSALESWDPNLI